VDTPGALGSLEDIPALFATYCRAAHLNADQVRTNTDKRLVFVGVVVQMEDPQYFDDDVPVRKGLASALGDVLGCHQTVISHTLRTVKNYRRIYPTFRAEMDYFYDQLTTE
jgi:hypothetical protein